MSYENMVSFIRERMAALGINQVELATKAGLSASQISRILKLESTPSQDAIVSIARALRVPADAVFRAAGLIQPTSDDPWVDEQAYRLKNLTGSRRKMAESLLRNLEEQEMQAAESEAVSNRKLKLAEK